MGSMNEAAPRPLRSMVSTGWPNAAIRARFVGSREVRRAAARCGVGAAVATGNTAAPPLRRDEGAAALQAPDCCVNRKPEEQWGSGHRAFREMGAQPRWNG